MVSHRTTLDPFKLRDQNQVAGPHDVDRQHVCNIEQLQLHPSQHLDLRKADRITVLGIGIILIGSLL
jgi:hypothetical protein